MGVIGDARSDSVDLKGNTQETFKPGAISLDLTPDKLDSEIQKIRKQRQKLQKYIDTIIKFYKETDGDKAAYFLDKPVSDYDDYDKQLAALNPELYQISQKIDKTRQQIKDLERQEINLVDAQKQMYEPLEEAKQKTEQGANEQLRSIATQKDIQVGAAQGLAGKAGATTSQLANINAEISNKYAPQALQVQAQRDAQLANIAGVKSNIPGKLSAIAAQNVTNEYNKERIEGQKLYNQKTKQYLNKPKTTTSTNSVNYIADILKKLTGKANKESAGSKAISELSK